MRPWANIQSNGLAAPLNQTTVVGGLGLCGNGQALEDMRLKGPGKAAQRPHHRELATAGGSSVADGSTGDDGRHDDGCDGGGCLGECLMLRVDYSRHQVAMN